MSGTSNKFLWPLVLITSLFFLWALAHNLNDILIRHFQKALDLNRGQAGFIQFAFYLGYFFTAIPAGLIMKRAGYKKGILLGLLLYAGGALLFLPAAEVRVYGFFLVALFVIAAGLTFLETAANPYITKLGDPEFAERRINFAQAFNGLGSVVAPMVGGLFIFSGVELSANEMQAMTPEALDAYRAMEARMVQWPYFGIVIIVLAVAFLIHRSRLPEIEEETVEGPKGIQWKLLLRRHLIFAVVAQFFYVGAQVGIWSYFIDFMKEMSPETSEKTAAYFLSVNLFLFMIGRFSGSFLMTWVKPKRLLAIYAIINVVLVLLGVFAEGMTAVYAVMAISFFMSIMFPTIFALGIKDLGSLTKIGSSFIIMSIIGGALFPLLMGYIAIRDIQAAFFVPLACFLAVFTYALWGSQVRTLKFDTK